MAAIILIILIAYIYHTNNKISNLKQENEKLRRSLTEIRKGLEKNSTTDLLSDNLKYNNELEILRNQDDQKEFNSKYTGDSFSENKTVLRKKLTEEEKQKIKLKKEKEERERKNTTILITGAILIVLSAIVFLMSTWYTIPNILKTTVLVLLIGVFFGGSKIAKEKFNLEKTSNTFFYIAMAYIPICLFSISFFGLLGEFLSFRGDGGYIYLTIAGIFTAFIYWITYIKNKNVLLFYGSLLTQVFSVILFSLIFSQNIELISLNLLLYNILFIILTYSKFNIPEIKIKNIYSILPYICSGMLLFILENINIFIPINLIILAINYGILAVIDKKKINSYLLNIVINILGVYLIWNNNTHLTISLKIAATLLYSICVYIVENIILIGQKRNDLKVACSIVTLILLGMLFIESYEELQSFIRPYIISLIQLIILTISYVQSKELGKKITSLLIPICFIITGTTLLLELDATYHYYIIFGLLTFVIGESLQGKKVELIRKNFFAVSNLFIGFTYFFTAIEFEDLFFNDVMYFILLFIVYTYSYFVKQNKVFKYLSYLVGHIALFSACDFFAMSDEFILLIPTITLIALINLENKFKFLKDSFSEIFFSCLKIIAYIFLTIIDNEIRTIISIGLTSYLLYNNYKNKENSYYNIIPLIGTMPNIFDNNLDSTLQICIMLLSTIGLSIFAMKNRCINIYTIFSGIYLFGTLTELNTQYVNEILFLIWSACNCYFMEDNKEKDIFKILTYIGVLVLYNVFAEELELIEFTLFNLLGYILFAIALIRTILNKYINQIDLIEAITFICIYLFAITLYSGEYDGMLFGLLIVSIILFSYIKKYGTLFLTSIAAILLNVFLLTREFWFSIPWWVYLLILGSILITFAIKNEANENNKVNIGETFKKLKDKIEK